MIRFNIETTVSNEIDSLKFVRSNIHDTIIKDCLYLTDNLNFILKKNKKIYSISTTSSDIYNADAIEKIEKVQLDKHGLQEIVIYWRDGSGHDGQFVETKGIQIWNFDKLQCIFDASTLSDIQNAQQDSNGTVTGNSSSCRQQISIKNNKLVIEKGNCFVGIGTDTISKIDFLPVGRYKYRNNNWIKLKE